MQTRSSSSNCSTKSFKLIQYQLTAFKISSSSLGEILQICQMAIIIIFIIINAIAKLPVAKAGFLQSQSEIGPSDLSIEVQSSQFFKLRELKRERERQKQRQVPKFWLWVHNLDKFKCSLVGVRLLIVIVSLLLIGLRLSHVVSRVFILLPPPPPGYN